MTKISGQYLISGQFQDNFKISGISGISGQLGALLYIAKYLVEHRMEWRHCESQCWDLLRILPACDRSEWDGPQVVLRPPRSAPIIWHGADSGERLRACAAASWTLASHGEHSRVVWRPTRKTWTDRTRQTEWILCVTSPSTARHQQQKLSR